MELSPAAVIVLLGGHATLGVQRITGTVLEYWKPVQVRLGGRRRLVMLAQHPNSHQPRRWDQHISREDLHRFREAVTDPTAATSLRSKP